MRKYRDEDAQLIYLKNVRKFYRDRNRRNNERTTSAQLDHTRPPPLKKTRIKHIDFDHEDKFVSFSTKLVLHEPVQMSYYSLVAETELAVLVKFPTRHEKWLPKRFILINFKRKIIETSVTLATKWEILRYKNPEFIWHGDHK